MCSWFGQVILFSGHHMTTIKLSDVQPCRDSQVAFPAPTKRIRVPRIRRAPEGLESALTWQMSLDEPTAAPTGN